MAKQHITQLIDDIDGSAIAEGDGESIEFSVNGLDYVIDLKAKNAKEFHKKLDSYIEHGTRVGGRRRRSSAAGRSKSATSDTTPKRDPAQTRAIRQWAADNGYEIAERGRIPSEIEEAYHSAT